MTTDALAGAGETGTPVNASVFPDGNFRAVVSAQADRDGDGMLSKEEIESVTEMDIVYPHSQDHPWYGAYLSDMYDYLARDDHTYDGTRMDVTGLDTFQNLEKLRFHNVEPVNIPFSSLEKLKKFEISSAPRFSADFAEAPGLEELAFLYTEIGKLNLSQTENLKKFTACHIGFSEKELDFSAASGLEEIGISYSVLNKVSVRNNAALKKLSVQNCGLRQTDLSGGSGLQEVRLDGNKLKKLDVSANPELTNLYLDNNSLTKLDLTKNRRLGTLSVNGCAFTKLNANTVRVSDSGSLTTVSAENLDKCTVLDVSHMASLKELHAATGGFLKVSIAKNLTDLDITRSGLTEINAKSLRAPAGAKLRQLRCSLGRLKKINVSHLKNLKSLIADGNKLTEVNVSGNRKLTTCILSGNKLKRLVVSRNADNEQKELYKSIVKENGGTIVYKPDAVQRIRLCADHSGGVAADAALPDAVTYVAFPAKDKVPEYIPLSYVSGGRQLLTGESEHNRYAELAETVLKDAPAADALDGGIDAGNALYGDNGRPEICGAVASSGGWNLFPDKVRYQKYDWNSQPDQDRWQRYFRKKLRGMSIDSPVVIKESYLFDWDGVRTEVVTASNAVISKKETCLSSNGKTVKRKLPSNKKAAVYTVSAMFRGDGTVTDIFCDAQPVQRSEKAFDGSGEGIAFCPPSEKGAVYQNYVSTIQFQRSGKLSKYRCFFDMNGELSIREYRYLPKYLVCDTDGDGKSEFIAYHDGSGTLGQVFRVYKLADGRPVISLSMKP